MADSSNNGYQVQVISRRYIRQVIFESYVNDRLEEFGVDWKAKFEARDNRIVFTALRKLTDGELDQLQERASPEDSSQSLFIQSAR